ncbi:tyrosine-type recombinase/integrase [Roseicella aquatilis]|uniref:tyrosine-type recombinase/integrase n=1 Tax=Roseicella aquatilis TaxID=2527868 RepID=UPI0014044C8D|nr:site-specific integrase [Roseicella aquatilis]
MKRAGNLDVKGIDALKPRASTYRVSDGGGLLLEVRPTGAKVWLCRLTVAGKRRDMGLGGYPAVSLKNARAAAVAAREAALGGDDPILARKRQVKAKATARAAEAEAEARTFRAVALACIRSKAPGWKNGRTVSQWQASMERHAFPVLGDMPVADVDRAAVLRVVSPVWTSRPAIGRKLLHRLAVILRYAAAHGWRSNDNPADGRMLKDAGLPDRPGGRKHPSLPWQRVPAFMKALGAEEGLAPLALRFCILTALRSGEVRGARWSELSFDGAAVWTVPGERMKAKKAADVQPHRVPLSPAAVAVLARAYEAETGASAKPEDVPRLARIMGEALIFPSRKPRVPLSDMALSAVLRRMNADRPEGVPAPWCDADGREAVPHGFRSSFRMWVQDTRPTDAEAAEKALAHEDTNKVRGAYARSDLFDLRTPLMSAWAAWCEGKAAKPASGCRPVRKASA